MIKWLLELILMIVAPIILIVIGASIMGFGAYMEWDWVINTGVFVGALGVFWGLKLWWAE